MRTLPILLAATLLCACRPDEAPPSVDRGSPSAEVAGACLDPDLGDANCFVEHVGPLEIAGRAITVALHRVSEPGGRQVATEALRVRDAAGELLHDERFDLVLADHGFESWTDVDVRTLHGEAGAGIAVHAAHFPSAPLSGEMLTILVPRGDRLAPLAPPLATYGTLRAPPRPGRLHDGDHLVYEVWTGYFAVVVPVHVDLAGSPGHSGNYTPRPTRHDPESGLALLDVVDPVLRPVSEPGEVTLYPSPSHPDGRLVTVRPGAEVRLLEAAGRPTLEPNGALRLEAPVARLRVHVDGVEGWVEAVDYHALGVMAAG